MGGNTSTNSNNEIKFLIYKLTYANLMCFFKYFEDLKKKTDNKYTDQDGKCSNYVRINIKKINWEDQLPFDNDDDAMKLIICDDIQMKNWKRFIPFHTILLHYYKQTVMLKKDAAHNPKEIVIYTNVNPEAKHLRRELLNCYFQGKYHISFNNEKEINIKQIEPIKINIKQIESIEINIEQIESIKIIEVDQNEIKEVINANGNNDTLNIYHFGTPYCDIPYGNNIHRYNKITSNNYNILRKVPTYLGIIPPDVQGTTPAHLCHIKKAIEKHKEFNCEDLDQFPIFCVNNNDVFENVKAHNDTDDVAHKIEWDNVWP